MFIGLYHLLTIAVGIKAGTHLSKEKIQASIKEIME